MTGEQNGISGEAHQEPDFAQQAFKDLARGEQTAAALERHLDAVEKQIEELLARADENERRMKEQSKQSADKPSPNDETTTTAS
ncbi:hypothetical protein K469DRAFT_598887 [Zopfia rhizophila CBS 207.26]|uniref:Uncharacterized protein n=1 Tax=Zopfia rhizophila CBS 207.26 TaxID=1314779 RepID=A0A6A6DH82_9PEZI|nr:hypothetical protein K469DRAFT_598887 [Zopfia rhizophila CBS 207.26]